MTVLFNYRVYGINILPEGLLTIACLKRRQMERYAFNFCTHLCMFLIWEAIYSIINRLSTRIYLSGPCEPRVKQ